MDIKIDYPALSSSVQYESHEPFKSRECSQAKTKMGGQRDWNIRTQFTVVGYEDEWSHESRNSGNIKEVREACGQQLPSRDLSPSTIGIGKPQNSSEVCPFLEIQDNIPAWSVLWFWLWWHEWET